MVAPRCPCFASHAILALGSMSAAFAAADSNRQRLREAILCEAQQRIQVLTSRPSLLYSAHHRDGVAVQQTKADHRCDAAGGSGEAPITVGNFNVEGVHPVDIFNVLSDERMAWDSTATSIKHLGDFQDEGVRGMYMVYPTGVPFVPSREVAEWFAFNASMERNEFWVAFSTQHDEKLESLLPGNGGNVRAQNCLGAYRITPTPTGAHVVFTQHVNGHAPVLPASLIASVTWGQQVDYINNLRTRAKALAKRGTQKVSLPSWLLQEDHSTDICDSEARITSVQLFSASLPLVSADTQKAGRVFMRFSALGMMFSAALVLGWQRLRQRAANPLPRTTTTKTAAAGCEREQEERLLSA